jgi:hypothetical protein
VATPPTARLATKTAIGDSNGAYEQLGTLLTLARLVPSAWRTPFLI